MNRKYNSYISAPQNLFWSGMALHLCVKGVKKLPRPEVKSEWIHRGRKQNEHQKRWGFFHHYFHSDGLKDGVAQPLLQNLQEAIPTAQSQGTPLSDPLQSFLTPVRQTKFLIDRFSEASSFPTGEKKEKAKYKEKVYLKKIKNWKKN